MTVYNEIEERLERSWRLEGPSAEDAETGRSSFRPTGASSWSSWNRSRLGRIANPPRRLGAAGQIGMAAGGCCAVKGFAFSPQRPRGGDVFIRHPDARRHAGRGVLVALSPAVRNGCACRRERSARCANAPHDGCRGRIRINENGGSSPPSTSASAWTFFPQRDQARPGTDEGGRRDHPVARGAAGTGRPRRRGARTS